MADLVNKLNLDAARDILVEKFEDEKFFKKFVKKLNDSVDVPMIGEGTERKVIKGIVVALINALKHMDLNDIEEQLDVIAEDDALSGKEVDV